MRNPLKVIHFNQKKKKGGVHTLKFIKSIRITYDKKKFNRIDFKIKKDLSNANESDKLKKY